MEDKYQCIPNEHIPPPKFETLTVSSFFGSHTSISCCLFVPKTMFKFLEMKMSCFALMLAALTMAEAWSHPVGNSPSVGHPHRVVMDATKYQETGTSTDLRASSIDGASGTDHGASDNSLEASDNSLEVSQSLIPPQSVPQPSLHLQPPKNTLLETIRQQSIILRTSLAVAAVTAGTSQLPYKKLRADMLAGTVIFMAGDWGAQLLTHSKNKVDKSTLKSSFKMDSNRFVISAVLGCFWAGICNPAVYTVAEHLFPGKSVKLVLTKMCFSLSILSTAGNYATMAFRRFFKQLWDARTTKVGPIFRACIQSCNQDMIDVLKIDLKIWPL